MEYKDVELMSDRELLEELVTGQRIAARNRKICLIILLVVCAVIIALLCVYVPKILSAIRGYEQMILDINKDVEEFKKTISNIPGMDGNYQDLIQAIVQELAKMLNPFK